MKTLFLYTNINGFHEDSFPFGLTTIISMVKKDGHQADTMLIKTKAEYTGVLDKIASYSPRVIGFSAVSSQFCFVKEIAALIKQRFPKIIIVCGGVHPTINPQCILESDALDAVFVGESEYAFTEFLQRVEIGEPYEGTDNLAYVDKDGKLVKNKLKPLIKDLDVLPFPDRSTSFFQETLESVRYAPFFFSRGCPYLCTYCSNHAIARQYGLSRSRPRYRGVESCIQEIEEVIRKYPVSIIAIVDDIFGIHKRWRKEFCEKYKQRIKIKFFCLLRANVVDEEFVQLLKDAGCYRVSLGVESGNEYIRNTVMKRQMKTQQIVKAFHLLRKNGLQTNALNIIGVPGETEEMIWDTIKLNRLIKPTSSGVNIFYPYKGTELGDRCFEEGLVDKDLYYDFSDERRSSVLNYSEEYKKKLVYYSKNWGVLIYRFHFAFRFQRALRLFLAKVCILGVLRRARRMVLQYTYEKKRTKLLNEAQDQTSAGNKGEE